MIKYRVANTETGAALSEPFETIDQAEAEMYRLYPVVEPWDGVCVPVGVEAVNDDEEV